MIDKILFILWLSVTFWAAKIAEVKNWRDFPGIPIWFNIFFYFHFQNFWQLQLLNGNKDGCKPFTMQVCMDQTLHFHSGLFWQRPVLYIWCLHWLLLASNSAVMSKSTPTRVPTKNLQWGLVVIYLQREIVFQFFCLIFVD